MVCKIVDNIPLTLSQMYVEDLEFKFRHNVVGCNNIFSKLLKIFCYEYLRTMSLGPIVTGP